MQPYQKYFGISSKNSSLGDSGGKLVQGTKILNNFTLKPLAAILEDFLNYCCKLIAPDAAAEVKTDISSFAELDTAVLEKFYTRESVQEYLKDYITPEETDTDAIN